MVMWCQKRKLNAASSIREKSATMSDSSNDAGDLSLSCSVSSIESEESQVSEVKGDLETVEPYQFEPVASD